MTTRAARARVSPYDPAHIRDGHYRHGSGRLFDRTDFGVSGPDARALLGWVPALPARNTFVAWADTEPVGFSNVSSTARPALEASGLQVVAEQRPVIGGVAMTDYRMAKVLEPRDDATDRAPAP